MPKKVAVLGGGVIGVEFSSVWRRFGAEVTIIEALPHLVPNEDESISKQLERAFRKRGIDFKLGVRFQGVTQNDNGVVVTLENGETFEAELLLVAVGRGPSPRTSASKRSASRSTAASSPRTSASQTNVPGVYAVGDIVPGLQLAHRGFQQGIFVAEEIAGPQPDRRRRRQHPQGHLLRPRGRVGRLHRGEGRREVRRGPGHELRLQPRRQRQEPHHRHRSGSIKVVRVNDGPVVGVHMIGARVGELIGEAQLAVNWEAYPEDIAPFIHAHPTQNEALGEAFLKLAGKPLHAL